MTDEDLDPLAAPAEPGVEFNPARSPDGGYTAGAVARVATPPSRASRIQKEKSVNDDRITYAQLSRLIEARDHDKRAARAVENAVRGVNDNESAIRQAAAMIRSKLDEVEQRLDSGLGLNGYGELDRMPADFDRAVTLRQHHWQVLGALLTEAELASLQPAALPAPHATQARHPASAAAGGEGDPEL